MKKIHYSWAVCLGCTLLLFVCCGLTVNCFTVQQPYVLSLNGFTNTQTSMIGTVRAIVYLISMFLVNYYYEKLGFRIGTAVSALLSVAAYVLFAFSRSLASYYTAGALAGLSFGLGSMVPATLLLSRWFHAKRGLALGICAAGTGLATVIFSPILSALIENYSLKFCFLAEAGIMLLLTVILFCLIRDDPSDMNLEPYGELPGAKTVSAPASTYEPSILLWVLLFLAMCSVGAIASSGFTHMMILFTTSGYTPSSASLAISIFGFSLMLGKCVFGYVCDRLGCYRANYIFGIILSAGVGLCILADTRSVPLMYAASFLYGFGAPLSTVGLSVWAGDFSTPENYARRVQLFQLCYAVGALAFSAVPGMFADHYGSYCPAYVFFLSICLAALAIIQFAYIRKKKHTV